MKRSKHSPNKEAFKVFQLSRDGFRIRGIDSKKARTALESLLPNPDLIINNGVIFKQGSRNHSVRVELDGKPFFLKRYNCRGALYSLGNALRRSRAMRTWLVNLRFRELGLPVQEPLLCIEERRFRFLKRSYLLTGFFENTVSLMEAWPELDASEKELLLLELGEVLGKMHQQGGIHGDLKWYNILVCGDKGGFHPVIVDLDGSGIFQKVDLEKARRDVRRFLRDLEATEKNLKLKELFVKTWEQALLQS